MAVSFSHELVAMHCPVSRSTSIERPRQPSIWSSMGLALFLTKVMPVWVIFAMEEPETALPPQGPAPTWVKRLGAGVGLRDPPKSRSLV